MISYSGDRRKDMPRRPFKAKKQQVRSKIKLLIGLGKGSKKKNREYNEFGTKGGRGSDLNHYFKQLWNSEKGEGGLR